MNLSESFGMALTAIRMNKMRSTLTLLGIIIGVMTIIAMQSLITGLRNSVTSELSVLTSNVFQVQKYPPVGNYDRREYRNRKDLTRKDADAVRQFATAVEAVGAEVWEFGQEIQHADKKTPPTITLAGGTPEFLQNNGYVMQRGRFLTEMDVDYSRNVAIIGVDVLNELFPYSDPMGKEIKIHGERFLVVGLLEEMGDVLGNTRDNRAIIPITRFEKIFGKERSINITVKAKSPELFDTAMNQTIGILRASRKVEPGRENDFEIRTNDMLIDFFDNMTKYVRIVAIAIASISLIVAGVGIMNIMLVSVTERTREIGIRKAIGAKRRDILWQFMVEAVVLSQVGGVVGILLGILIGKVVEMSAPVPAAIPTGTVILGLLFCSVVGIVFGVYPATKASKLEPIHALRYE
ncbi:MAG: ABC transporter permease [candidate division KSB1 bacterium]|nr:ABC transporter permease [candidate division KSB1 bacterium]